MNMPTKTRTLIIPFSKAGKLDGSRIMFLARLLRATKDTGNKKAALLKCKLIQDYKTAEANSF